MRTSKRHGFRPRQCHIECGFQTATLAMLQVCWTCRAFKIKTHGRIMVQTQKSTVMSVTPVAKPPMIALISCSDICHQTGNPLSSLHRGMENGKALAVFLFKFPLCYLHFSLRESRFHPEKESRDCKDLIT